MEDVSKIQKKVEKTASTKKVANEDGLVNVEYTRKSEKYKTRTRMSAHLAAILEKRGIVTILK